MWTKLPFCGIIVAKCGGREESALNRQEFTGIYLHNIDPKGRVTIPSAYRAALGSGFTLGMNQQFTAMALYARDEWEALSRRLDEVPLSDARAMAYVRMIKAFSYTDQQLDGQGRLLLPTALRDRAHMDKNITFVGAGRVLEIWDSKRFDDFCMESAASLESLSDYVIDRYIAPKQS